MLKTRSRAPGLLAVALLVSLGAAVAVNARSDEETCRVSYTANWTGDPAKTIEWGVVGDTVTEVDVPAPWQKINQSVSCGKIVMLHVEFDNPAFNILCALTIRNVVHDTTARHGYRCFEQQQVS